MLKTIINQSNSKLTVLSLLAILLASWFAIRHLLVPGYFSMHDDLQAMRLLEMHQCFQDGQIPCRWIPDMGYGYGYPLFNYYPPMPYYLGEIFIVFGVSYLDTVKIISLLGFLTAAFGMYVLTRKFWGSLGGIVSAVFYTYAPYHAVDLYVRGAINEFWALAWFPWTYWSSYQLITSGKWKYGIYLAFFYSMLMLSHNPLLMIFTPTLVLWCLFWMIDLVIKNIKPRLKWITFRDSLLKVLPKLLLSAIWAFALSAFFTLPVLFEQKLAHVDSIVMGYFNYLAHFVNFKQLFILKDWGYGASRLGPDDMSFQIGHLHWIASLLSLFVAWKVRKTNQTLSFLILLMMVITYVAAFMTHLRSSFIWSLIPPLEYLQFPWRFLSLVIFGVSFLAGSLILLIKHHYIKIILFIFLVAEVIVYNQQFFDWGNYYPQMTDQQKFSGKNWQAQITSSIFDYLPVAAPLPPIAPPDANLDIIQGQGTLRTLIKNTH